MIHQICNRDKEQLAAGLRQTAGVLDLAENRGYLASAIFVGPMAQALGLNGADTIVHLASMLLAGYVGLVEPEGATA